MDHQISAKDALRHLLQPVHRIDDLDDLHALANAVASELKAGDVVVLSGELGSGKTTFTQCLAVEMGVGEKVTSPTFTLAAEYDLPHSHVANQLIHIDLYRWPQGELPAQDHAHMAEILSSAEKLKRIVVIEWAEKLGDLTPKKYWKISFNLGTKHHQRLVKVERVGEQLSYS